jgi:hypothetical protein
MIGSVCHAAPFHGCEVDVTGIGSENVGNATSSATAGALDMPAAMTAPQTTARNLLQLILLSSFGYAIHLLFIDVSHDYIHEFFG